MIQLALRSSIQAECPSRVGEVGEDRRQGDRRDHQLEPGQEHADPDDGEQHERRTAVHRRECRPVAGGAVAGVVESTLDTATPRRLASTPIDINRG